VMTRLWDRFRDAPWRIAMQTGLVPVSIGLIAASAYVITGAAVHTWFAGTVTLVTAALTFLTRVNPLWLFIAAAIAGLTGYI
jgi:chromate transporter